MRPYQSASWTDEMLMDLIQREDNRAAFAELYERYWESLVDTAYQRLKSAEAAKEVVQDIFISLFLRRESVIIKSTFEAYLKTALKYKVFNVYRTQQVHYNYVAQMMKVNHIDPVTPQHTLEEKELNKKIRQASDKMPEKCREVFLMSRFENLSHQDISERLGISISTVKKHITKALHIVRTDLDGHELDILALLIFFQLYK